MDFTLRPWKLSDAEDFLLYSKNPKILENMSDGFPQSLDAVKVTLTRFIRLDGERGLFRAIEIDHTAVGSIGIFLQQEPDSHRAELAYWLGEPYWRRAIMTAAVRALCQAAFESFDLSLIYAQPYACNTASRRMLEKAGFTFETIQAQRFTRRGNKIDACLYTLRR